MPESTTWASPYTLCSSSSSPTASGWVVQCSIASSEVYQPSPEDLQELRHWSAFVWAPHTHIPWQGASSYAVPDWHSCPRCCPGYSICCSVFSSQLDQFNKSVHTVVSIYQPILAGFSSGQPHASPSITSSSSTLWKSDGAMVEYGSASSYSDSIRGGCCTWWRRVSTLPGNTFVICHAQAFLPSWSIECPSDRCACFVRSETADS